MNRLFVVLMVVLAVTVVVVPTAQADHYFCATDSTWNNGANWKSFSDCSGADAGVPTAADRVIILSGNTCAVDIAASADSFDVVGTLNVQASQSLTIDDTDNSDSTVTGTINLEGSSSVLAFTTTDQTIGGAGKIVGQHNLAQITITFGETLTLSGTTVIQGQLKITGAGGFVNFSTVHANVAGTLEISTNTFDDDNTAVWQISTSSSAIMLLNATSGTAGVLEGDFTVSAGTMDVDAPGFNTTGRLTFTGGTIDASGLTGSEVAKFTG